GEDHMAVENGAHRVADGLIEIVTFDEHGEEAGDGALGETASAFEDLRQEIEDGRRIALLPRWFPGGQANFALGHRKACDGIHDEENVGALIAKKLTDCQSKEAGADPQWSRPVTGCDNDNRSGETFGTEFVFEEAAHFTIAFADESNDADVREVVS